MYLQKIKNTYNFICDFFKLWFMWGDVREAWQDAKTMNNPEFKKQMEELDNDLIKKLKSAKEYENTKKLERVFNHSSAILSFDEQDKPNVDTTVSYYYINSKGDRVDCNAMYLRDNDMVVVKNKNGCQVCLSKKDLYICKN
jgi:hypothetical protein